MNLRFLKKRKTIKWDMLELRPDGSFGPIHHLVAEVKVKNRGDESR